MNREILGDILKRMNDDGQPQENLAKVANYYNSLPKENKDPNVGGKNADGSWKTPEQIWEELQAKKEQGSQTKGATVEPQIVSGDTESASGDGSSEQVKPNQVIEQGGYEYKFDVGTDGQPIYYTKKPGAKNWIKVDAGVEDGKITNPAYVSIGQEFNHFDKDAFNRDDYLKQQNAQKQIEHKRANPTTLEDMGLTSNEDGSYFRNEDKFVNVDGQWYKQPIGGLPTQAAEGYNGKPVSAKFAKNLNNVLSTPDKLKAGVSTNPNEVTDYLKPNLNHIKAANIKKLDNKQNVWTKGLSDSEILKVQRLNKNDDFDHRNTVTWVDKNEATVRENIEKYFPGVNVEEVGAGNAVKINAPWRSKPYYVDLVPGENNFKKTQAVLNNFTRDHANQGSNVNRSLATVLGERQMIESKNLSEEGVDGANEIFEEAGLDYSVKIDYGELMFGFHQGYEVQTPNGKQYFRDGNAMTAWFYENLSEDEYNKMDDFMLEKRKEGIQKKQEKIDSELNSLSDEEINNSYWTSGKAKESVMFDLDKTNMSTETQALIKAELETPIMINRNAGLGSTNVRMVPKEGWEQERFANLLDGMKGKIPEEDYKELQEYVNSEQVTSVERLNDQKNVIAEQKGDLAFETYVGHKENVTVRISAKDMTNKKSVAIEQEKNGFVSDYKNLVETMNTDRVQLERSYNNINANMRRDGCGVNVIGEGEDATVVVSHPDPEKQRYYQKKMESLMNQSRTLKKAGGDAEMEFNSKYKNWQDKHVEANLDNKSLAHLVNKEYDGTKIVTQDFFDGFRSFGYNIPAAFNNDWAVEQAGNFNAAKSSFQTKLTMDQAAEFDQVGFTSWRTFNQQAGNMVVATASSFVIPGGALLGITGSTAATAGLYGLSSAGGKRVDLMGRNERGVKAQKDLDELEALYKDGRVSKEEYKKQAMALTNTINMGDIDSSDIWKSSIWSGVSEAGVMLVAGTAVNAMKFKGLMSGSFSSAAGSEITKGVGDRILNFAMGTGGMIGSELIEEISALGADKLGDAIILGDDVWEGLGDEVKETIWSTVISSGGMGSFGNAYSNITAHVANGPARNQWFNEIKPELKSIDNAITRLDPDSKNYMKDMKYLQDAKSEQIAKVVKLSKEAQLDALRLGPDGVQKLMVANKNLQSLYSQAGVVAGDSETVIDEKVQKHISKLPGELLGYGGEKADYKKVLEIAKKQVAEINGEFDYGDDKSAHMVTYDSDGKVKSEGSVHKMFGAEGVAMAENLIKKDPKFLDLSAKEKAVAVMDALKEKRDNAAVYALKKDVKNKEGIERQVYKNAEGKGITKAEWLTLNDKKRVPTDLKAQEDAMYNMVGQYTNARKGEALVLVQQGLKNGADMLQDQSLSGLEINQANGKADLELQVHKAVNDGFITEEKAQEIVKGIREGKVKAAILGNKYITTELNATQAAVAQGDLLAGTAMSHEIGHFIDDTAMNSEQRESYAGHLNEYMTEKMPGIHQAAIKRNSKFGDDSRYIPFDDNGKEIPFEKQTPAAKDEYTKSVQDELRQNKNISYLNEIKKESSTGYLARMTAKAGLDFNINNKNDAAAWMGSYLTGFEKGEVGLLQKRKLKNTKKTVDLNKDGFRTSSDLQNQLEQRSINEDGTPRTPTKADAEKMASDMLTYTPDGQIAEQYLDSELAQQTGAIIENITKKLYDPIAPDARNGVSRNDFKEAAVVKAWELMSREYLKGPKTMALDGYMSFLLNERSKDIARELGVESTTAYGGRGIDVNLENAKGIESDLNSEFEFDDDAEIILNPELPLTDNLSVSKADTDNIAEQVLTDVGVKLPAIDAQVSKNKFTTPLVAALKKAFGIKNGVLHKAMLNTIGKNKAEVEAFLTDPKNKLSILRSAPTSWLAKNIPSAVQKSVGGTRVKNGDGTTTFKPNWTTDWQGKKIDRWNAADVGPHRGNTSGPQVMKRHPSPSNTSNAEMLSSFAKGETMTDIRRNGLDKLAMMMAQEYGLETFKNDLNNDGPMSEIFRGRQELFDRVIAENHVEEINRQIQRGTVKFSVDPEADVNNMIGDAVDLATAQMLQEVIANVPKGGIKSDMEMDQLLSGYPEPLVQAFKSAGLYERFGKTKGYIAIVKDFEWPEGYELEEKNYKENAGSDLKNHRANLAGTTELLIDKIPSKLLKVMGYEFFGLNNPRVLDGAEKKRKGPNKGKPGAHYKLRQKIENKVNKNTEVDLPFDPAGVEMMNSKKGIMKDVQDILNMNIPKAEKLVMLERLQPRIDAANANNKKALKYIHVELAKIVAADRSQAVGAAAIYQSAGNNVNGFRALTDLSSVKVMDGSQAPYLTKDGKPTMTKPTKKNGGEVNVYHGDYARAIEMAESDVNKAGHLINSKGEHIDPSAPLQAELLSRTLKLADKLRNNKDVDVQAQIILEHENELDLLLATFDQVLGPVIDSDIQDNKLGKTSSLGYARMNTIPAQLNNYVDLKQGEGGVKLIKDQTVSLVQQLNQQTRLDLKNSDKAKQNARLSQESQGMSAFDFDETLIDKGDNTIIATLGDQTVKITSGQWPLLGPKLAAEGYNFNFDDFINVRGGVEGPLMQKFRNRIAKYGIENNYILTARPAEAAPAIQAWLAQQGIEMPLENITGLGNSTGEAKAQWMIDKFAEGYNDMYFVDDALPNVEAVQNVIDQLDIKGKAALVRTSQDISGGFNQILEDVFDIGAEKEFSEAKGKQRGKDKGKFRPFIPPSAEDFKGLLYNFLGKGKAGEAHFEFFKKTLIDPFAKAQRQVDKAQQVLTNDYRTIRNTHKPIVKKLTKTLPGTEFTYDQGVRVLLWDRAGYEIPGLSATDKNKILAAIKKEPAVIAYANDLSMVSKQDNGYSQPGEFWITETIGSDLSSMVQKIGRDQFLEPFKDNRKQMFGEWENGKLVGPNMNKIEAIYGVRFREALNDMLWRMENGTNRAFGDNRLVNSFANWINNSVGAIMFFNARSAVLQTLSTVNFINFGDNNIFAASKAFANQPQFWKDFSMIFNSDMLKQRRSGLKTDINQNEIANIAAKHKGNPKAILQHLLRLGFLPTQIADSFAISLGGASFYRNRLDALIKQGMPKVEAEKQAFIDFQEKAEENQQSSRPDMISQQQASALGRFILAFQNTPMQYARLTKKAALDLINRRGSDKQNISKIIYYGAAQNLIFSALQSAMFKYAFDDEEDEEDKRKSTLRVGNSMVDGFLRGTGVYGAIAATLKNMMIKFIDQEKRGGNMDVGRVLVEGLNISPPVGSKARKLYSGLTTYKFKKEEMYEMDKLSIDNPMYQTIGNTVSSLTNFPLDRMVNKTNNIKQAMNRNNEAWQRVALMLGYNTWDLGVENKAVKESSDRIKAKKEVERKKKKAEKAKIEKAQKEKERKEREAREVQCSAKIRKGKGPRCKNQTENKSGKCYAHQ